MKWLGPERPFLYDGRIAGSLTNAISTARLSTYLRLVGNGSTSDALDLYAFNAQLSGTFIFPIQSVEVAIRNRCDQILSSLYGPDWLTNGSVKLVAWQRQAVSDSKPNNSGVVGVDSFNFGFWTQMFCRRFDPIWLAGLHGVFSNPPSGFCRTNAFQILDQLREFRNRVAHHEQIIGYDPISRFHDILEVVDWIDTDQKKWVEHYSRVNSVWDMILQQKNQRGWSGF